MNIQNDNVELLDAAIFTLLIYIILIVFIIIFKIKN